MSKSYKKNYRAFFCTGRNTEWYRDRNRWIRNYNKQELRNSLKKNIEEAVDEDFKKY